MQTARPRPTDRPTQLRRYSCTQFLRSCLHSHLEKNPWLLSCVSMLMHADHNIVMASLSVCPSVCHTLILYLNKRTYRRTFHCFIGAYPSFFSAMPLQNSKNSPVGALNTWGLKNRDFRPCGMRGARSPLTTLVWFDLELPNLV